MSKNTHEIVGKTIDIRAEEWSDSEKNRHGACTNWRRNEHQKSQKTAPKTH